MMPVVRSKSKTSIPRQNPTSATRSEPNLDELLKTWSEYWAKDHKSQKRGVFSPSYTDWVDYTGQKFKRNEKKPRLDPRTHRLNVQTDKIQINPNERETISSTPPVLYRRQRINKTESPQTLVIEEQATFEDHANIQWTHTLSMKGSIGLSVSLPTIAGIKTGLSASIDREVDLEKTTKHTATQRLTLSAEDTQIKCPPGKITEGRLTVTKQRCIQPFKQAICLSGFVVICCQSKVEHKEYEDDTPHYKWAIPVAEVFQNLNNYAEQEETPRKARILKDQLKEFEIKDEKVHFTFTGRVTHSEWTTEIEEYHADIDPTLIDMETVRQALIEHEGQVRTVERLFYADHPIPIEGYFIHLSIVGQENYRNRVRALQDDESRDNYDRLFGQTEQNLSVHDILVHAGSQSQSLLPEKILITGEAGIGKTTLSRYLPSLWGQGRWGKQYDWVFHLTLRQLLIVNDYPRQNSQGHAIVYQPLDIIIKACLEPALAQHAPDLLKTLKTDPEALPLLRAQLDTLLQPAQDPLPSNSAPAALFILDGYDEIAENLPPHLRTTMHKLVNHPHVILTSRPYHLASLTELSGYGFKPTRRLAVTGFTNENIEQYIERFFTTQPTHDKPHEQGNLLDLLKRNSAIHGTCRIPINLELMCTAWYQHPFTDKHLSMSQLYHRIIFSLGLRYLEKSNQIKLTEIPHITEDRVLSDSQFPLGLLEYLGYFSLRERTLFFQVSDALNYLKKLSTSSDTTGMQWPGEATVLRQQKELGFIKPDVTDQGRFEGLSRYFFNHLTFRDCFAARFLAGCLQYEAHKQSSQNPREYRPVTEFPHDWAKIIREQETYRGSFRNWLNNELRQDQGEVLSWFMTGELARAQDHHSLRYFFDLLNDGSFDQLGYHRACLLTRCIDEMRQVYRNDLPMNLQPIVKLVIDWLVASLNPNHSAFLDHEKSENLWARWRLSPALSQDPLLIEQITHLLPDMHGGGLCRLTCWLDTINDLHHPLIDPLFSALGHASMKESAQGKPICKALESSYQIFAKWRVNGNLQHRGNTMYARWIDSIKQPSESSEATAFQVAAIYALAMSIMINFTNDSATAGLPYEWIELVKQMLLSPNDRQPHPLQCQVAAIYALANVSACVCALAPQRNQNLGLHTSYERFFDLTYEWMMPVKCILDSSTDRTPYPIQCQIASINAIVIASVGAITSVQLNAIANDPNLDLALKLAHDWMETVKQTLQTQRDGKPYTQQCQVAAIHALSSGLTSALTLARDISNTIASAIVKTIFNAHISAINNTVKFANEWMEPVQQTLLSPTDRPAYPTECQVAAIHTLAGAIPLTKDIDTAQASALTQTWMQSVKQFIKLPRYSSPHPTQCQVAVIHALARTSLLDISRMRTNDKIANIGDTTIEDITILVNAFKNKQGSIADQHIWAIHLLLIYIFFTSHDSTLSELIQPQLVSVMKTLFYHPEERSDLEQSKDLLLYCLSQCKDMFHNQSIASQIFPDASYEASLNTFISSILKDRSIRVNERILIEAITDLSSPINITALHQLLQFQPIERIWQWYQNYRIKHSTKHRAQVMIDLLVRRWIGIGKVIYWESNALHCYDHTSKQYHKLLLNDPSQKDLKAVCEDIQTSLIQLNLPKPPEALPSNDPEELTEREQQLQSRAETAEVRLQTLGEEIQKANDRIQTLYEMNQRAEAQIQTLKKENQRNPFEISRQDEAIMALREQMNDVLRQQTTQPNPESAQTHHRFFEPTNTDEHFPLLINSDEEPQTSNRGCCSCCMIL